jgi:hypothetical protein
MRASTNRESDKVFLPRDVCEEFKGGEVVKGITNAADNEIEVAFE